MKAVLLQKVPSDLCTTPVYVWSRRLQIIVKSLAVWPYVTDLHWLHLADYYRRRPRRLQPLPQPVYSLNQLCGRSRRSLPGPADIIGQIVHYHYRISDVDIFADSADGLVRRVGDVNRNVFVFSSLLPGHMIPN